MEAGQYKPLAQNDMDRIHQAALHLLETIGLGQAIPSCLELMTAQGCFLNGKGRLCIPRGLVGGHKLSIQTTASEANEITLVRPTQP